MPGTGSGWVLALSSHRRTRQNKSVANDTAKGISPNWERTRTSMDPEPQSRPGDNSATLKEPLIDRVNDPVKRTDRDRRDSPYEHRDRSCRIRAGTA